jgi:hypothetical protein
MWCQEQLMVTQPRTKDQIWDREFAETREFLANFGISPRDVDEYVEEDVLKAIHRRGWEHTIEREEDPLGWRAEIREWRHITQSQVAVARDPDRIMALLRALRIALTWPTPEEDLRMFDEQTRILLGMSAKEFLDRLYSGDLPTDDPRVTHLMIMRPLGT